MAAMEIAVRFGYGMEGVINESSDGQIFFDMGLSVSSVSTSLFCDSPECRALNQLTSVLPARSALFGRMRMPFWAVPGDLIVALPLVGILWPDTYASMAVVAANGGVIPWQAVMTTSFGSFQFILGREASATFYGFVGDYPKIILPIPEEVINDEPYILAAVGVKSLDLQFPILEYRPFRTFSQEQSTSLRFQFFAGVDIPIDVQVIEPLSLETPDVKPIWSLGLRMNFDWRWYLN